MCCHVEEADFHISAEEPILVCGMLFRLSRRVELALT
jgi:hypothetical protein